MHSAERYNHKTDHSYTHEKHYHAARAHQKAHDAAKKHGIEKVVFDRGGFQYQGVVAALADGARKGGLTF